MSPHTERARPCVLFLYVEMARGEVTSMVLKNKKAPQVVKLCGLFSTGTAGARLLSAYVPLHQ